MLFPPFRTAVDRRYFATEILFCFRSVKAECYIKLQYTDGVGSTDTTVTLILTRALCVAL